MSVLRCPYAKASAPHTYDAVKLEHDPEKWVPVFGKRSCSNKAVERDDDSKKNHPALNGAFPGLITASSPSPA
jgi:hypothetical protein